MSLHVGPGEIYILDNLLADFSGKETILLAFCLYGFDCGAVAFSASLFPFGVFDGRCWVTVSIPDQCLPFCSK